MSILSEFAGCQVPRLGDLGGNLHELFIHYFDFIITE